MLSYIKFFTDESESMQRYRLSVDSVQSLSQVNRASLIASDMDGGAPSTSVSGTLPCCVQVLVTYAWLYPVIVKKQNMEAFRRCRHEVVITSSCIQSLDCLVLTRLFTGCLHNLEYCWVRLWRRSTVHYKYGIKSFTRHKKTSILKEKTRYLWQKTPLKPTRLPETTES